MKHLFIEQYEPVPDVSRDPFVQYILAWVIFKGIDSIKNHFEADDGWEAWAELEMHVYLPQIVCQHTGLQRQPHVYANDEEGKADLLLEFEQTIQERPLSAFTELKCERFITKPSDLK